MPCTPIAIAQLPGGGHRLTYAGSTVDIATFGAHVVSWTTPGGDGAPVERLWTSSLSAMDGSAPIRGGIPVAWPQFANDGAMPLHGFARERAWRLVSSEDSDDEPCATALLELTESAETLDGSWRDPPAPPFPWRFRLELAVTLGAAHLQLRLSATNLGGAGGAAGGEKLAFTCCLHTYFRTADSTQVRLHGKLRGATFVDKVDGMKVKVHGTEDTPDHRADGLEDSLTLEGASAESSGFVDRIYANPPSASGAERTLEVGAGLDPAAPLETCAYVLHQGAEWSNTVVFNPWREGKRGDRGPDFDDDGYKHMVCVEPAVALPSPPVELAEGETWTGSCIINLS